MKFLTWNIKDGGVLDFNNPKVDNIDNILNIIKKENPDVIVIQEYQSEFYNELIRDGLNKLFYTQLLVLGLASCKMDYFLERMDFRVLLTLLLPYLVRSYLFLGNKRCCIYVACSILQTPI